MFEDLFKSGNIVAGLAVGIGIAVLVPVVLPILRPLAKSVIKAGLIAYDQGRVALSEVAEATEDIVAEARAELGPAEATAALPVGRRAKRGD
jgi:hypothetical protein